MGCSEIALALHSDGYEGGANEEEFNNRALVPNLWSSRLCDLWAGLRTGQIEVPLMLGRVRFYLKTRSWFPETPVHQPKVAPRAARIGVVRAPCEPTDAPRSPW
jgi:hypothetical protein